MAVPNVYQVPKKCHSVLKQIIFKWNIASLRLFLNDFNLQWAIFTLKMPFLPEVKDPEGRSIHCSATAAVLCPQKLRQISHECTELEVFVDKTVCGLPHADREGKQARRHNKKAWNFPHPFIHNSTLLSTRNSAKFRCNQSWILACYKLPYIIKCRQMFKASNGTGI